MNSPKKIVLADDSVTMHRAVKLGLKKEPFDVLCCDNGQDAWRIVKVEKPDVVLADLDMPGMTGAELCQKIKNDPELAHIPVILVCGSFDQIDEKHLEKVPADARLWKPFETHVLTTLLAKVLDGGSVKESAEATSFGSGGGDATAAVSRTEISARPQAPKRASEATRTGFEPTSSQHLSEPVVRTNPGIRNVEVPGVGDASDSLLEGFQDIPMSETDSVVHSLDATEIGLGIAQGSDPTSALGSSGESYENLWASDPVAPATPRSSNEVTQHSSFPPARDEDNFRASSEATSISSSSENLSWGGSSYDESEKSFSNEVFEAVESRNFEEEEAAIPFENQGFEATEVLGGAMPETVSNADLQGFREETSQSFPPRPPTPKPPTLPNRPSRQTTTIPQPSAGSSLVERSASAAHAAAAQNPGLSEEELRKIIREEIQTAISGWLKNKLHDELDRVIEEIDRE
jgi:CheY-like chemotaxis protein